MDRTIKINKKISHCSECDYFVDSVYLESDKGHFCNHQWEFMAGFEEQDSKIWTKCELPKSNIRH